MNESDSTYTDEYIESTTEVLRNRKYEPLVELLCTERNPVTNKAIFTFNKDLMVFAAMVGYTHDVQEEVEDGAIKIVLQTYATDNKDSFIYMLALMEQKKMEERTDNASSAAGSHILKNENIRQAVKPFERYCNGGLKLIKQWFDDSPGEANPADILVKQLWAQANKDHQSENNAPDPAEIEF